MTRHHDGDNARVASALRRDRRVAAFAVSGVLLTVGYFGARLGLPTLPGAPLYFMAIAAGCWYFALEAIEELIRKRETGFKLFISIAAVDAELMAGINEFAIISNRVRMLNTHLL